MGICQVIRDDWRRTCRTWSVWVSGAAAALYAAATVAPGAALDAWKMLPPELQSLLPHSDRLAATLFGAVFVLRFVKQEKRDGSGKRTDSTS
jgi:hypothetical protein